MMEIADLPFCVRGLEFFSQPGQLLRVHVVAIQGKEGRVPAAKVVVPPAIHVEGLVEELTRAIVISKARIELDSRIQQRFVWALEFAIEIGRTLTAIEVIAHCEHKLEREHFVK